MTNKFPCSIQFNADGHVITIVHKTGKIIAKLFCHEIMLFQRVRAVHDQFGNLPNIERPTEPFLGEVFLVNKKTLIQDFAEQFQIADELERVINELKED